MTWKVVFLGLLLICLAAGEDVEISGQMRKASCPEMEELMACPMNLAPVCGSDGNTYANECALCVEKHQKKLIQRYDRGQKYMHVKARDRTKLCERMTKQEILVAKEESCCGQLECI